MYTFEQKIIKTTPQKHVNVIHQSNNTKDNDNIPLQIHEDSHCKENYRIARNYTTSN